jgi:hypothetical protein
MTVVKEKLTEAKPSNEKEPKIGGNTVVESYPSQSVIAAREMASAEHGNPEGRVRYSRILIEESQKLGASIVRNRTGVIGRLQNRDTKRRA